MHFDVDHNENNNGPKIEPWCTPLICIPQVTRTYTKLVELRLKLKILCCLDPLWYRHVIIIYLMLYQTTEYQSNASGLTISEFLTKVYI